MYNNHVNWAGRQVMSVNNRYGIFEASVINAYDLGKLDKESLTVLMEACRDTKMDYCDSRALTT